MNETLEWVEYAEEDFVMAKSNDKAVTRKASYNSL